MSRNPINFSVTEYPHRRINLAKPVSPVTLVPVFSSESTAKTKRPHKRFAGHMTLSGFVGGSGQTFTGFVGTSAGDSAHLVHFGLGKREEFDLDAWKSSLIAGFKKVKGLKTSKVSLVLPDRITGRKSLFGSTSLFEIGKTTAEMATMVLYHPNHYKTESGGHKPESVISDIEVSGAGLSEDERRQLHAGLIAGNFIGTSVNLSRDTANEPANICTPTFLANLAQKVAAESGGTITVKVFDRDQCQALGMNAFLAVAKGSDEPCKFIVMDYAPAHCDVNGPVLGLVGKSITFDSGGLDIKPADGMRDMRYDMSGGADMIAAMRAIAALGVNLRVKAFMAATENMTGGKAYRPGDVYVGLDGKSYEIDNTDAEGRVTLVDAIAYARKHGGVTHIVDYATLTGACVVALGDVFAGVVTNNQDWACQYLAAANTVGELAHQLPTHDKFKKMNKAKFADLKNSGGRYGGAITAGLFVLSAAGDTPCVHVDIAGVANRTHEDDHDPEGGTGWGVRTLVQLAINLSKA